MTRQKYSRLIITTFNANSLTNQKCEIIAYLKQHNVDVLLIQETHLDRTCTFKIPNYTTYRNDRDRHGGGTAVVIRSKIKHQLAILPDCTSLELTAIQIPDLQTTIISAYKRPSVKLLETDLKNLLKTDVKVIIGGDLNCKHTNWHSTKINTEGRRLYDMTNPLTNVLITAPTESTRYSHNCNDVLDIFILKTARDHNHATFHNH